MIVRKILFSISCLMLAAISGCMSMPSDLNVSLDRSTDQKMYLVEIHPITNPIVINKLHAWEIKVKTAAGEAVSNSRIEVSGGMSQHGHGFPTHPEVTKALGDGRYLLEGMKFSMSGWWQITLKIASPVGTDTITFNTMIAPSSGPASASTASGGKL